MKELNKLTNTEKAKLIHQLFPDEIPGLLEDILAFCDDFNKRFDEYAAEWGDHAIVSVDYWYGLALEMKKLILKMRFNMERSYHVFGDQMAYAGMAMFFNDRLVKYAKNRCDNEKFKMAVLLLYEPVRSENLEDETDDEIVWFEPALPMKYGERIDYFLCICGNYEKGEGFNRCDLNGDRIPLSMNEANNTHGLCERCGCIIDWKEKTVIGQLKNFQKRE